MPGLQYLLSKPHHELARRSSDLQKAHVWGALQVPRGVSESLGNFHPCFLK